MEHRAMLYDKERGAWRNVIFCRECRIEKCVIIFSMEQRELFYIIQHGI